MTEKLRKVLTDVLSGKGDLWKETEVAARILLAGGYPGHSEDLACLEGIEDCTELENLLSRGSWYFQETDTWKYETQTLYNREGGMKMAKKLEVIKKEIEKEMQKQCKKLNEKKETDYCPGCNVAYCQGRYTTGQCE